MMMSTSSSGLGTAGRQRQRSTWLHIHKQQGAHHLSLIPTRRKGDCRGNLRQLAATRSLLRPAVHVQVQKSTHKHLWELLTCWWRFCNGRPVRRHRRSIQVSRQSIWVICRQDRAA